MQEFEYTLENIIELKDGTRHEKLLLKSPTRQQRRLCQKVQGYCAQMILHSQNSLKMLTDSVQTANVDKTDTDDDKTSAFTLNSFRMFLNQDQNIAVVTVLEDLIYNCCFLLENGTETRVASDKQFGKQVFDKISNADLDAICDQYLAHFIEPSII